MIGIVGGVGPLAGIDLFNKITQQTSAGADQEHLPVIMFSFPDRIKDRTEFLEGRVNENPGLAIGEICVKLSDAGALVAGIPCNTAHAAVIFDCIIKTIDHAGRPIKIVHMINETISRIKKTLPQNSSVGILSTTGTYRQKIYYNKLSEAGYVPIVPDEDAQTELVHNAIYHPSYGIKSTRGKITLQAKSQLIRVMDMIKERGANTIILGCSEIGLAVNSNDYDSVSLIDPTEILATSMIKEYLKLKKQ